MRVYSHTNWLPNLVNFCRQPIAAIAAQCLRGRGGKIMKVFGKKTQFFLNTLYLFHNSFPFLHPNSHYRPVTPAAAWQAGPLSLLSPKLLVTHSCKINHIFLPLKRMNWKTTNIPYSTQEFSRVVLGAWEICVVKLQQILWLKGGDLSMQTNIMVKGEEGRFVLSKAWTNLMILITS